MSKKAQRKRIVPPVELKPCPHCGGEVVLDETRVYALPARRVRCPKCHICTEPVMEGLYSQFDGRRNVSFTLEQAEQQVIARWNRRAAV